MANNGWVKFHRKIIDWEWYTDIATYKLFTHLLLIANREDGKWRGVTVKRGQVVRGRKRLATETGLSEQQVRTALNKLIISKDITIKATNQESYITIGTYNEYQATNESPTSRATNNQPANQPANQPTINQPINHKQEVRSKEVRSKNKDKHTVFPFKKFWLDLGVDEETLNDWLIVRKNKKSSNTETAFNSLIKEIEKSGLDTNEAIKMATERSWAGFKSQWIENSEKGNNSNGYSKAYNASSTKEEFDSIKSVFDN